MLSANYSEPPHPCPPAAPNWNILMPCVQEQVILITTMDLQKDEGLLTHVEAQPDTLHSVSNGEDGNVWNTLDVASNGEDVGDSILIPCSAGYTQLLGRPPDCDASATFTQLLGRPPDHDALCLFFLCTKPTYDASTHQAHTTTWGVTLFYHRRTISLAYIIVGRQYIGYGLQLKYD